MKHAAAFLTLVIGALTVLGALLAWYLGTYSSRGGSFGGMMGQMIGGFEPGGSGSQGPGWVPFAVLALILVAISGAVGTAYFTAYPEIRPRAPPAVEGGGAGQDRPGQEMGWSVLMRTSKPEEKRVLEILAAHGGSYLQKFVVKEAGLSRLKTHRIVSRLAERGVVAVERTGNTNQVSLAPWVRREERPETTVSTAG